MHLVKYNKNRIWKNTIFWKLLMWIPFLPMWNHLYNFCISIFFADIKWFDSRYMLEKAKNHIQNCQGIVLLADPNGNLKAKFNKNIDMNFDSLESLGNVIKIKLGIGELSNWSIKKCTRNMTDIIEKCVHQWSMYLGMLGKGLQLGTTALLVFSLVSKVFEKLVNNRIVDHLEKRGLFSDFQYCFLSSRSTADLLLTVVLDRIARAFNRSGVTWAVALDISKVSGRVCWHAGLLHKSKACVCYFF